METTKGVWLSSNNLIFKTGKTWHFTKEYIQITYKHVQRWFATLVIREMHIKTILKPTSMFEIIVAEKMCKEEEHLVLS